MTEEESDKLTMPRSRPFHLALRHLRYIMLCLNFIFDIVAYMVAKLSFILQVAAVSGGQSAEGEPARINKGKVIRCFLFD